MGMSLVESPQHLKRKTGLPKGRLVGSANPGLADRLKRWRWSERCAERTPKLLAFYDEVLDTKAEDGKGPDGHGWAYTFEQRRAIAQELRECAFGKPAQQVSVDQTNVGIGKIIHEVQWLPPDPNDRSKVIEPEPD